MACRGIRGAITVEADEAEAILAATRKLLEAIVAANDLSMQDLAGVIFTVTADLTAAPPARAAREMGWTLIPMLCTQEMAATGDLAHCIRVLILWNTELALDQIRHVYMGQAQQLRPDLAAGGTW